MNVNQKYDYINTATNIKDQFYRFSEVSNIAIKEVDENWEALKAIRDYIPLSDTYEIASGHGLLGTWIAWMGLSNVTIHDIRYQKAPPKAYRSARKFNPHILHSLKYESFFINSESDIKANAIIGVHACGDLTDFALRLAVRKNIPIAVMTCCHGKIITNTERCKSIVTCDLSVPSSKLMDLNRAYWLSSQGFDVKIKEIKGGITGEPRIILGRPLEHEQKRTS